MAAKRGIWQGSFQNPADYRQRPSREEAATHGGCLIKGNINAKGRCLYYLPGSSTYGKTKIDEAKGERWFCTEDQARAAGWMAAQGAGRRPRIPVIGVIERRPKAKPWAGSGQ